MSNRFNVLRVLWLNNTSICLSVSPHRTSTILIWFNYWARKMIRSWSSYIIPWNQTKILTFLSIARLGWRSAVTLLLLFVIQFTWMHYWQWVMEKSIVIETDHPISVINNNNSNNANNNKKCNWYLYVTDMPLKLLNSSQLLFSMYYWLFSDLSDIRWSFIRWLNIRFFFL